MNFKNIQPGLHQNYLNRFLFHIFHLLSLHFIKNLRNGAIKNYAMVSTTRIHENSFIHFLQNIFSYVFKEVCRETRKLE